MLQNAALLIVLQDGGLLQCSRCGLEVSESSGEYPCAMSSLPAAVNRRRQHSIGLADCPGTPSSTGGRAVSHGSQFCWTLGVASCVVWCNPTSLCCE